MKQIRINYCLQTEMTAATDTTTDATATDIITTSISMPESPSTTPTICVPTCASHQQCISGVCVGRGSLSFTLTWSRAGDGDIIVTIPNGNTIMYSQRGPNFLTNYGQLDVDDQRGTGPENIYWNSTEPASGTYQVCFQQYSFNTFATPTDPITAVVEVNRAGHDPQTFRKTFTQRMPFPLPNNCQESYDTYLGSIVY
ncbi:unnamed protein product [Rotaria sp. Silwood2]|nr:unnamed protein product [Rotaria sp. Silwood2]CAF4505239.1 unnamed protein product [Rotaria sp. Silwood2]